MQNWMVVLLAMLAFSGSARGVLPATAPADAELKSPAWWIRQAAADLGADPDASSRGEGTAYLTALQARCGDRQAVAAGATAFERWTTAAKTPREFRSVAYGFAHLCKSYGLLGDAAEIQRCIEQATTFHKKSDRPDPDSIQRFLIRQLCDAERVPEAKRLALAATRPSQRRAWLEPIVHTETKLGKQDDARKTLWLSELAAREALTLKLEDEPHQEMEWFAHDLIYAHEWQWAQKTINELPAAKRPNLLVELALLRNEAGDRKGALASAAIASEAIRQQKPEDRREWDVAPLAGLQEYLGDSAGANKTRELLDWGDARPMIGMAAFHYHKAYDAAMAGDAKTARREVEAMQAAMRAGPPDGYSRLFGEFSQVIALTDTLRKADKLAEAEAVLSVIAEEPKAAASVRRLRLNLDAAEGHIDKIQRLVENAVGTPLERRFSRSQLLTIAAHGADAKRLAELHRWIASLESPTDRWYGYISVAEGMLEKK